MLSNNQLQTILQLEQLILQHDPIDYAFNTIPTEFIEHSPILKHAYGTYLSYSGDLLQAKEVKLQALKGFAKLGLHQNMLVVIAHIAIIYIQIGQVDDAKEQLCFLHAEWNRRDEGMNGDIPHALGRGASLIDASTQTLHFYDEAITMYVQKGNYHTVCQVWLDKLMHISYHLSTPDRWEVIYSTFEHFIRVHRLDEWYAQMAQAHQAASNENYSMLRSSLEQLDHSKMSSKQLKWKKLLWIRLWLSTHDYNQIQDLILVLDQEFELEIDMELILEWRLIRAEWYSLSKEWKQTERELLIIDSYPTFIRQARMERRKDLLKDMLASAIHSPILPQKSITWNVYCLGDLRFEQLGKELRALHWKRIKTKELFVYLLLQPHFSAHREQVAEHLFTDLNVERMINQLYVIIHQLKITLKQFLHIDQGVFMKNGIIRLSGESFEYVDYEHYSTLIRVGNQLWVTDKELAVNMLEKAIVLYERLVPDLQYLDWLNDVRNSLLELQLSTLNKLGVYEAEKGNSEKAEEYYLEWITLNPLDESAYQHLIKLLIQQSRQAEAEKWYRKLEQLCQDELSTEPLVETKSLLQRLS
jgi:two-component SAPR family response regulator